MRRKTILLTVLAGALTATTTGWAATATLDLIETFHDERAWEERVSSWMTEDFEDATLADGLRSIDSKTGIGRIERGPWTIGTGAALTSGGLGSGTEEGQWRDVLTKHGSAGGKAETSIRFDRAVASFGALFDILPAGRGTSIWATFKRGGDTIFETEVAYFQDGAGFWGVVAEETFDEIVMVHGTQRALKETYAMHYMKYGVDLAAPPATNTGPAVPLPASIWMFISVLIGMTCVRRPRAKRL